MGERFCECGCGGTISAKSRPNVRFLLGHSGSLVKNRRGGIPVTDTERICKTCDQTLPISEFKIRKGTGFSYTRRCKECLAKSVAAARYGVSFNDIMAVRLIEHCEICGAKATDIDHDHFSGAIRGHLCHDCNTALGFFGDSVERLSSAIAYLMKSTDVLGSVQAGELSDVVQ